MRFLNTVGALMIGAATVASPARAQTSTLQTLATQLGQALNIYSYTPQEQGAWQTSYQQWTPVTVYEYQGHYYRKQPKGARTVVVYRANNEYFLPPSDRAWVNADKRYNYAWAPDDRDRGRAKVKKAKKDNPGRGRGRGNGKD